mgnify:CR=1 FL=1
MPTLPLSDLIFDGARDSECLGLREKSNIVDQPLTANLLYNNAVDLFLTVLVVSATPMLLSNALAGEINKSRKRRADGGGNCTGI